MALTAEDPETTTKEYKGNLEMANILTTYVCVGGRSGLWGGARTDVMKWNHCLDYGNCMTWIMISSKFSRQGK